MLFAAPICVDISRLDSNKDHIIFRHSFDAVIEYLDKWHPGIEYVASKLCISQCNNEG